ncbi:L-threonylcarbamoyladenylate synthase [Agrococcus carbonis]|uniref:L-threonylcarbamoyladenylate synthase n=1 Tax=Agrococcus carbonis TaxID=684552 RepID=A0A1H1S7I7_9MICO|nr:L-threonylcarbamoyladenylate synthase [Agrococcus carbonis]SDS43863.1 tRNA threonylcarbamoyl adenosine modification protein, Sua5/YciO/YrdC/YwlC family [Agrococcus carbonis]
MPAIYDCADPASLLDGVRAARTAVAAGQCIVMPTDTVYGIAADAFSHAAVAGLLAAKGRDRGFPPPVLVADRAMATALAEAFPPELEPLLEAHWPGPLTVIVRAQPSLTWDLGDTGGTVALRVPDHPIALGLLRETGPLAVSSANLHGMPAATTAQEAAEMLGDRIALVLDAGPVGAEVPAGAQNGSTILDCSTGGVVRIVRQGVLPREAVAAALGDLLADD